MTGSDFSCFCSRAVYSAVRIIVRTILFIVYILESIEAQMLKCQNNCSSLPIEDVSVYDILNERRRAANLIGNLL